MFVDGSRSGRGTGGVASDSAGVSTASGRGRASRQAGAASSAIAPRVTFHPSTHSSFDAMMSIERDTAHERRVPIQSAAEVIQALAAGACHPMTGVFAIHGAVMKRYDDATR